MPTLEERVAQLEQEVKKLQGESLPHKGNNLWVEQVFGRFKDDPLYDAAMKAGAEYRKSQVPDYMRDENVPS